MKHFKYLDSNLTQTIKHLKYLDPNLIQFMKDLNLEQFYLLVNSH